NAFSVADPAVSATGGFIINEVPGQDPGTQTVATFTDPGGAESLGDYSASILWGDGLVPSTGTNTFHSQTSVVTVNGDHTDAQAGIYTITVTINHDQAPATTVTSQACLSATVQFGGTAQTVIEGSTATLTVVLNVPSNQDVQVDYATADGTASTDLDYTA